MILYGKQGPFQELTICFIGDPSFSQVPNVFWKFCIYTVNFISVVEKVSVLVEVVFECVLRKSDEICAVVVGTIKLAR